MLATIRPWLATILVIAASGCAQTRQSYNPLAWLKKTDPEVAQSKAAPFKPPKSKDDDAGQAEVAADDPPATNTEPTPDEQPVVVAEATTASNAQSAANDKPAGVTVHDAETLALIDEELAHASPDEREKLFAEWKTLDAAMVRQVIRIRKMVRELESSSPAATAAAPAQPASLPGAADPWSGDAPPPEDSRVLALGSPETATTLAQSRDDAPPQIQPAGHNEPAANTTGVSYGHATTRPVPVVESLGGVAPSGVSANGGASGASAASLGGSAGDAWMNQLRQLIALAESRAEQSRARFMNGDANAAAADETARQQYVESQVHLRLLYLMAGEQARALQAIPGLAAADQEFWQQVLWGVANYFDAGALPNRADRVTQTIEQLRTAIAKLQGEANLQLRNVAFCHKITSFGNFERFERDEYTPGQRVLLYAEILNFKSEPQAADGLFKTQLKSTIEIFRAGQGQPVKKIDFDPTVDLCRSYRQDYFHSYELKIPTDLTLGPHTLKLTVEDIQSGKLATYSVNFAVK